MKPAVLAAGLLILVQAFLIFVPMIILGGAISWPESLDYPPAQALPLIREQIDGVRLGYGVYLLYSVLFAVTGTVVVWLTGRRDGAFGPLMALGVGLACVSALARAIGIVRWLTGSTALAEAYAQPGADRPAIEAVQLAVNAWGGSVGENLGVAIFASLWAACVSVLMIRRGGLMRWVGLIGVAVAVIVILPAFEMFGMDLISIIVSTTALHLWLMLIGALTVWSGLRERQAEGA